MNYYFEDFTEQNYKSLLLKAKAKWQFIGFDEYNESPINAQKSGGGSKPVPLEARCRCIAS